jgi:hypothetical protein
MLIHSSMECFGTVFACCRERVIAAGTPHQTADYSLYTVAMCVSRTQSTVHDTVEMRCERVTSQLRNQLCAFVPIELLYDGTLLQPGKGQRL